MGVELRVLRVWGEDVAVWRRGDKEQKDLSWNTWEAGGSG